MKNQPNQSPKATEKLIAAAIAAGVSVVILESSKAQRRRHHPLGSTNAAQKVVMLDGVRMSLGQGKEYIKSRAKMPMNPQTGSVDTADNWEAEGHTQQNADLIEVVKNDSGEWEEA